MMRKAYWPLGIVSYKKAWKRWEGEKFIYFLLIEMYQWVDSTPKKNNKQIFGIYVRTQQSTQMVAYASIKINLP